MNRSAAVPRPLIRAASVLIENSRILLVKQEVTTVRHWALPGGKLEFGETLSQCIIREMKEETGLDCCLKELLYMTDRIIEGTHLVHISFLVERTDNQPLPLEWKHVDPYPSASSDRIREARMVGTDELQHYGFSPVFCRLVIEGFPGRGSYRGDFHAFYGE